VTPTRDAFACLVLERLPQRSRIGLTLGFIRTYGVPEIADVLYGTGALTGAAKARAKATGAAMFTLIGHGVDSPEGRRVVAELRRVHRRPGITGELMQYVLGCFTVCPVRFVDAYGRGGTTAAERAAAYAFHVDVSRALGLPDPPDGGLAGVGRWMDAFERARFAPTPTGRALWEATSGLLATRLPRPLRGLAPALAATLLDPPLRAALGVARPALPLRWAARALLAVV